MKKVLIFLAVLALAAPVFAQAEPNVYITCSNNETSPRTSTISYDATDAGVVRAFSMDLTVSAGTITAISGYDAEGAAAGTTIPVGYSIYMSSIDFGTDPNNVDAWGDPVADALDPDALGGLGTAGITVEMGSLYDMDAAVPDTPPLTGDLFTITVSEDCDLTIEDTVQKGTRGGIVLEDESGAMLVSSGCSISGPTECFPNTGDYAAQYASWTTLGKPDCWCAAPSGSGYQCHGDADGAEEGAFIKYRVYNADLGLVLNSNWRLKTSDWDPTDPLGAIPGNLNPCADIDHKEEGAFIKYRVYNADLARVLNMNWRAKTADLPQNCPLTDAANDAYVDPTL